MLSIHTRNMSNDFLKLFKGDFTSKIPLLPDTQNIQSCEEEKKKKEETFRRRRLEKALTPLLSKSPACFLFYSGP